MGPGVGMGGGQRPSLRKALGVLGDRNYRNLFIASAGGFVGMNMQQVARAVLAWQLTESYALTGLVTLSFALPMLLFSLIGGAVADRVNKRNLQLVQQALTGVLALFTAFLVLTGAITVELLFIVGLIQGTFFAFGMPARTPLMAQVVGPQHLMAAIALSTASMNATKLVGPAVAGVLIAVQGIEAAYFAQAVVYLITVPFILLVPSHFGRSVRAYDEGGRGGSMMQRRPGVFADIRAGLSYVAGDKTIRRLMILGFITTLFGMPYVMLLPGFVDRDLGLDQSALGFLMTVSGVGALFGSLLVASMTEYDRKPMLQFMNALAAGVGLVALGALTIAFGLGGALIALVILGFAFSAFQTLNNTMVIGASDPAYQGRVMSIYMLTFSTMPIMAAPLGIAADRTGAPVLFIFLGVMITVMFVIAAALNPRYTFGRHDDTPRSGPSGDGPPGEGGPPGGAGRSPEAASHLEQEEPSDARELAGAGPPRLGARNYMGDSDRHARRDYMADVDGPRTDRASSSANDGGSRTNGTSAAAGNRPRDYGVGEANGEWASAREYGLAVTAERAPPPTSNGDGHGESARGAVADASPVLGASAVTPPPARRERHEPAPFEVWTAAEAQAAEAQAEVRTPATNSQTPATVEPSAEEAPPPVGGRYAPPTEHVTLPPPAEAASSGNRQIFVTSAIAAAASAIGALLLRD